jgi:CRISPR-associated protein Cas1
VEYLPVRYLNEFVYCPRLGYLEWVEAEFKENYFTLDGTVKHRRVDEEAGAEKTEEEERIHGRAVYLSAESLGLTGRIDVLEGDGGGLSPVEYKRGKVPDVPCSAHEPERVQVCAYALLLRDNGHRCERGYLYYVDSKKRVEIPIDEPLVQATLRFIDEFRDTAAGAVVPPPLENSPKCYGCSLVGICLPDETNLLSGARDDALPVYVTEQGASVGKDGELLVFKSRGTRQKIDEVRLMEVSQLCVFGNVQISTQVLRELCVRGITTCYFSSGGWFYGTTQGHHHKNVMLRIAQFSTHQDADRSLDIAKQMVCGKVKNTRTIIRRNHPEKPADVLRELAVLSNKAKRANSPGELLGLEGSAARAYYSVFSDLLKGTKGGMKFDFTNRNRRPPRDPVNALLSFVYAMLVKDLTVILSSVGFDPYLGVFHRPRYGRPALALDLAEEFRPLIGDSVVLGLINNQEVGHDDFVERVGSVAMSKAARKRLISAYERRMDTLIRHPVFGYTVSYRRIMEVQARLLGRVFTGEIPAYQPFCTR